MRRLIFVQRRFDSAFLLIVVLLFYLSKNVNSGKGSKQITCRNQDGKSVDWFIGYKLPRRASRTDPQRNRGFAYLYTDQTAPGQLTRSKDGVDTDRQSVAYTLDQLYSNRNQTDVFRLLYNDELPQGNVSSTKAHAKGVLAFDSTSGFWLIHSVPKFPPANRYGYPPTGAKYGQSFLCVTFPYSALKEIANQLYLYNPYIYDWSLPPSMAKDIEILGRVVRGEAPKQGPYNRTAKLVSMGGVQMTSFAKYKKWGKELYRDFVAPTTRRTLFAETWQIGRGDLGPSCQSQYKVYDIRNVTLDAIAFSNYEDHAKWAVSDEAAGDRSGSWVCIGDINRQEEQLNRSGGTMCMRNKKVWKTFRDSIKNYSPCPVF